MSNGYAQGVRLPYAAGPAIVHRWVERELGAPVVEVVDCVGGMSPGPAARVIGADGRRAFVKACSPELNPQTPALIRSEAVVLAALPRHPSLPRLLGVHDDGDWVALLIEDVDGRLPTVPWRRVDLDRVSRTLTEVRDVLDTVALAEVPRARDSAPVLVSRWRTLSTHTDRLGRWWLERLDALTTHAARAVDVIDGESLLHWDIRADNVILGEGRTVFVDWGQVRLGAPWMDHAMLALDCSMTGSEVTTAELARTDPVLRYVDPDALLAVAAAAAMSFKARSFEPPTPGLPTLPLTSGRWADAFVPYLSEALDRAGSRAG